MARASWLKSCQQACRRPNSSPEPGLSDPQLHREQLLIGQLQQLPDGIGLFVVVNLYADGHGTLTAGLRF